MYMQASTQAILMSSLFKVRYRNRDRFALYSCGRERGAIFVHFRFGVLDLT